MKGRISNTKERRKMPFLKIGMAVEVDGIRGKVIGEDPNCNLMVEFGGEVKIRNPRVNIKYFDRKDQLIAEY